MGHEGSGIIESVGEGVSKFKPGDSVLLIFLGQCDSCRVCTVGIGNTCQKFGKFGKGLMPDGTSRFTCNGKKIFHFVGTSTFTEYTVVHENHCVKINSNAPLEKVCLLSCGIPTGYGSAVNTAKVRADSSCAVFGLGAIGLAAVMGCRDSKASKIVAIDINSDKFSLARELGATECINPKDLDMPIENYLQNEFGGMDYTFECIGLVETMQQCWESTFMGHGVCVLIGVTSFDKLLPISPITVQLGRTLKGSMYGGYKSRDDIPALVEKYLDGNLEIDKFITHYMSLDKINDAFDLLKSGKCIRTVLKIST